jgi:hypothetical protein
MLIQFPGVVVTTHHRDFPEDVGNILHGKDANWQARNRFEPDKFILIAADPLSERARREFDR